MVVLLGEGALLLVKMREEGLLVVAPPDEVSLLLCRLLSSLRSTLCAA